MKKWEKIMWSLMILLLLFMLSVPCVYACYIKLYWSLLWINMNIKIYGNVKKLKYIYDKVHCTVIVITYAHNILWIIMRSYIFASVHALN